MPTATLKPEVLAPPTPAGRPAIHLPDAYVKSVGEAFKTLPAGNVVTTGTHYPTRNAARKAVDKLRRELVRLGYADDTKSISGRIWQDTTTRARKPRYLGGVKPRS